MNSFSLVIFVVSCWASLEMTVSRCHSLQLLHITLQSINIYAACTDLIEMSIKPSHRHVVGLLIGIKCGKVLNSYCAKLRVGLTVQFRSQQR